jgi:hypothetical protein
LQSIPPDILYKTIIKVFFFAILKTSSLLIDNELVQECMT